jgi:two-component system osmolarity sensor histidine kinase EnvZ
MFRMIGRRIRGILPRGLYGRAALILLLPILTLQLVVSVVFIQRHYDGVAAQMTSNLAVSLNYLLREIAAAPDLVAAQGRLATIVDVLGVRAELPPADGAAIPAGDLRAWDDLTGRAVIATLRSELATVQAVDLLGERRQMRVWLATGQGPMLVSIDRWRVSASNPHQLLVIVMFTGLLMAGIAFLFLRNQLRPIKQLSEAAEAFGKGRVLRYRPRGATEVRAAGRAFLDMRDRIERQIEQRTLMLSAVSHDLRTPLTRLKLGLALLPEDEETVSQRADLERDIEDMERLVESFLAYARGAATDPPVPTDPLVLVRGAVERARRWAAPGAVDLIAAPSAAPLAALRPQLLSRALDNLIGNALSHGRHCSVRLDLEPGAIRIAVEDDGPGIPETQRAAALQPFARLDSARNLDRRPDGGAGVGLGLAIVADVVRGHGGLLRLDTSPSLGGLRAEIVLPK